MHIAEVENGRVVSFCSCCTTFPASGDALSSGEMARMLSVLVLLVDAFISLSLDSFLVFSVMFGVFSLGIVSPSARFRTNFLLSRGDQPFHNFLKLILLVTLISKV